MITSTANPAVRRVIQLQKQARARRREGAFPAEGLRLCSEIPDELYEVLYVGESFLKEADAEDGKRKADFLSRIEKAGVPWEPVSDHVLRAMSDTTAPQGVLAVCRIPKTDPDALLNRQRDASRAPFYLLLEDIQDPGNLGTMFRTAEGAGADGIFLSRGCADIWSPKVVRSTMGSLFRVPHAKALDWDGTLSHLKERGICLYAADLRGAADYDAFDYRGPAGFLIGNEGSGLTEKTSAAADVRIRIPMEGQLESLNAAMSAGILMYECRRQRRRS